MVRSGARRNNEIIIDWHRVCLSRHVSVARHAHSYIRCTGAKKNPIGAEEAKHELPAGRALDAPRLKVGVQGALLLAQPL